MQRPNLLFFLTETFLWCFSKKHRYAFFNLDYDSIQHTHRPCDLMLHDNDSNTVTMCFFSDK